MKELTAESVGELINYERISLVYLYTPLCGTCQMAGKMLAVVEQLLPEERWFKANLNFFPNLALEWEVESVPCLLVLSNGQLVNKYYAFHSVPYLYETLKQEWTRSGS